MTPKEIEKLKKLADTGSAVHQQKYAKLLYWGHHSKKDLDGAKKYYELAAKQGNQLGMKGLERIIDSEENMKSIDGLD